MKKELSTTEMFYGILNQRGIAMLIEQVLMVACVKIAGIEASIVSLLAISITLWLPTIVFVIIWELILRPDAIKRLPDFAGQPTAFSGSFSERWHQFCELPFRQRLILVCMAVECVLTVVSTISVVLLDIPRMLPYAFMMLRCSIEYVICRELFRFTHPSAMREAGQKNP